MLTKFSEAISSSPSCWRRTSLAMALAISGSNPERVWDIQEFFMIRILLAPGRRCGGRSFEHSFQFAQLANQPRRLFAARVAWANRSTDESESRFSRMGSAFRGGSEHQLYGPQRGCVRVHDDAVARCSCA